MSWWSPLPRTSRFGRLLIWREVRFGGSRSSSGNEFMDPHPSISKVNSDFILFNPQFVDGVSLLQFIIVRDWRSGGKSPATIDPSFSQQLIISFSSEMRCWSPEPRFSRSGRLLRRSEVRVMGNSSSSGSDNMLLHPPSISKWVSHFIWSKPQSLWGVRLLQLMIIRDFRFGGKLHSEIWESSVHLDNSNFWRHGRQVFNLTLGSDFRFGQFLISISRKNVRTSSRIERDERSLQSSI